MFTEYDFIFIEMSKYICMHIFARNVSKKISKEKNKSVLHKLYNDNSEYKKDSTHLSFHFCQNKISFSIFPYSL